MKYLLDTCVLLWFIQGDQQKIKDWVEIIENPNNVITVSVASYWEIVIKKALKKISIPNDFLSLVQETQIEWLPIELWHIAALEELPLLHTDPFDRLIITQAKKNKLKLLSLDEKIHQYF